MQQAALDPNEPTWQEALSNLITDPKELLDLLELDPDLLPAALAAAKVFPLKVPRAFIKQIEKNNVHDPLLKQILPLGLELVETPGYVDDPLNEAESNPVPGLLHKYDSRVLVTLTSACAVHCRYCFRRYFPYSENNPGTRGWEKIFTYIRENSAINEVILSGGDPLAVSDHLLKMFSDQLQQIPHMTRLRIHTRLPIVLPQRITTEFLDWITSLKLNVVMVIHANHPNEISDSVKSALIKLRHAGVTLLNQSVLLKDVNDNAETLMTLSEVLFTAGVLPYYLHVLDKVQGAAHFDMAENKAHELRAQLMEKLPGYLVPRLAREEAGMSSKTLL